MNPDFAEALNDLGLALQAQGKLAEAVLRYEQAVQLKPDLAEAHNNLGSLLRRQGKLTEAVLSFQRALRLVPASAEVQYNLANALKELGQVAEAVVHYQEAVRLKPHFAAAHHNLGIALLEHARFAEAEVSLQQALHLHPNLAETHYNLGIVLQEQGKLAEAIGGFKEAIRLRPNFAEALNNLGITLQAQGEWADAAASFEQALQVRPDFADARHNRSMLWLLQGNFEQGWPEYEWRWRTRAFPTISRPEPLWDGGPLSGKTILLHAEQGLGDTLHFVRYAAVVKERGATVVVACQAELLAVLAGCRGIDQLLPLDASVPTCDLRAPLMSLPGLCGTTFSTIPSQVPYLVADRARVDYWAKQLSTLSGFKVGISWQGSRKHRDDRRRSVPLAEFAPAAKVPGVHLVSLQKGPGEEQMRAVDFNVIDFSELDADAPFVDSAALMQALDLVITCDTAVAHLAGALGRPVWVALPFSPDWRWLLERTDSPWYPTMRLFRQRQPGDWSDVFARVGAEVQKAAAHKQALQGSWDAAASSSSSS